MMQTPHALSLQATSLYFSYANYALLRNFSADISGGVTLICGGDGRGKSTLLKLLAGSLAPQSGQLHINGIDLQRSLESYRAQVFLTEPRSEEFNTCSVLDYFELQRTKHAGFDNAALADMTHGLGLQDHLHKQLFMLSTGSKRKVFLAAAFASNACVTLLDEPFSALDAISIDFVLRHLQSAASIKNRAFIVADYAAPAGLPLTQTIDLDD